MAATAAAQEATLPPIAENAAAPAGGKPPPRRLSRARNEAPRRKAFLDNLLNEDLQKVTEWHGMRPHHEQKRFLKSVDMLYKAFSDMPEKPGATPAQVNARAQQAQAQALAAALQEEDGLTSVTPRGQPAMVNSASAPSLPSKPIEVFAAKKKQDAHNKRLGADPDAEDNSLMKWLEAQSMSSSTTGGTSATRLTAFSQLTKTDSVNSFCSEPGTMNQAQYRRHKRAFAINRNGWDVTDQHNPTYLKDGVPNVGFPDCERMHTTFKDAYGSRPMGENLTKGMYAGLFQSDQTPFVERFLDSAPPEQKEQFTGMVRSLQFLRREHGMRSESMAKNDFKLQENRRLFHPKKQNPVMEKSQCNLSKIPLGSLPTAPSRQLIPPTPPPKSPPPTYSPSVSGLGSCPLTPRSLPTPLVGGKHLPFANAPTKGLMMATH